MRRAGELNHSGPGGNGRFSGRTNCRRSVPIDKSHPAAGTDGAGTSPRRTAGPDKGGRPFLPRVPPTPGTGYCPGGEGGKEDPPSRRPDGDPDGRRETAQKPDKGDRVRRGRGGRGDTGVVSSLMWLQSVTRPFRYLWYFQTFFVLGAVMLISHIFAHNQLHPVLCYCSETLIQLKLFDPTSFSFEGS